MLNGDELFMKKYKLGSGAKKVFGVLGEGLYFKCWGQGRAKDL